MGTGVVILIGTAALVVGFVDRSRAFIYVSIGVSVVSPVLLIAGLVLLLTSR